MLSDLLPYCQLLLPSCILSGSNWWFFRVVFTSSCMSLLADLIRLVNTTSRRCAALSRPLLSRIVFPSKEFSIASSLPLLYFPLEFSLLLQPHLICQFVLLLNCVCFHATITNDGHTEWVNVLRCDDFFPPPFGSIYTFL